MYFLNSKLWFPSIECADEEGLLAIGGDLQPQRLLLAYQKGIFPWFIEAGHIFWFCPPERCVIYPEEVIVSHSMRQLIRKQKFHITEDVAFSGVIKQCADTHRFQSGSTWISREFILAYTTLHQMGIAKSIEVWEGEDLVGGLYGIQLGRVFCGESMFSRASNASKLALIHLCRSGKYDLIDCQVYNPHLVTMGARSISRGLFLDLLTKFSE